MIPVLIMSRLSGNNILLDEVRCCVIQTACRTGQMNLLLLMIFLFDGQRISVYWAAEIKVLLG